MTPDGIDPTTAAVAGGGAIGTLGVWVRWLMARQDRRVDELELRHRQQLDRLERQISEHVQRSERRHAELISYLMALQARPHPVPVLPPDHGD